MGNYVIVITGPTGSGKSKLAIKLATTLKTSIISADSRKIYREMNIGTHKYDLMSPKANIKVYGIDLINPNEKYNLHKFLKYITKKIDTIHKAGKIPIVVGGTVLYITALIKNYNLRNSEPNYKLREELEKKSLDHLQAILIKKNIDTWYKLNNSERHNKRRLIRWNEILISPKLLRSSDNKNKYLFIPLIPCLSKLKKSIETRVKDMLHQGLIEETRLLLKTYSDKCPGLVTMGYNECVKYLKSDISYRDLTTQIVSEHYNYARYQIRWIKKI